MERPVAESWASIVDWLTANLPHYLDDLQAGATAQDLAGLAEGLGYELPSDLVSWLSINNGFVARSGFGNLIPVFYTPMSASDMLRQAQRIRRMYSRWERPAEAESAGSPTPHWLSQFLPIGDSGSDSHLFVDLRDGELRGSIGQFDGESGGFDSPRWLSVAEMLADIDDALVSGRPALQGPMNQVVGGQAVAQWTPVVAEGRLTWQAADS